MSSDSLSISHNKNDNDDESEVLSNSLQSEQKKSSGTMSREDSLENRGDMRESIEEEIVEEIIEELVEGSTEKSLPAIQNRNKRQLFNLDDDEASVARDLAKTFGIDDSDISIGNIAQEHKRKLSDQFQLASVLKQSSNKSETSDNKRKSQCIDSLEEPPNSLESSSSSKENVEPGGLKSSNKDVLGKNENVLKEVKELSPLQEDVILINNNKVSLNILKQIQAASQDNSLNNTTNDISDLAKDTFTQYSNAETSRSQQMPKETQSLHENIVTPDVSVRGFNSLGTAVPYKLPVRDETDPDSASPSMSCGEEDKSIEEMIIENSIEISSKSCVLDDMVEHTDVIKQNIDFEFKDEEEKSETVERSPESPENLKEKILLNSATFAELQLQRQAEGTSNVIDESSPSKELHPTDDKQPTIKKMQRADTFNKELLDDISEESDRAEHSRSLPDDTSKLIEKGSIMRRILEQNITRRGEITNQTLSSDVLDITTSTINTSPRTPMNSRMGSVDQETEAVIPEQMRAMEARIKDLQNIVTSKDICISALNSRLENLSRRGSWKEGRDSLQNTNIGSGKESSSFTSTIYKDVNEDAMGDVSEFNFLFHF